MLYFAYLAILYFVKFLEYLLELLIKIVRIFVKKIHEYKILTSIRLRNKTTCLT